MIKETMKKIIIFLLLAFATVMPEIAHAKYVRGYTRKDGTYVSGYNRGGGGYYSSSYGSDGDIADFFKPPFTYIYMILALVILAIIIGICLENKKKKQKQAARIEFYKNQYARWRNEVNRTGTLETIDSPLLLKKGEECLWTEGGVVLHEPRAVRRSTHTYGSVPIGKTRIRVGRGYSTSESTDEWRAISKGQIYVTNKGLYYDGDKHDRKIPFGKIITLNVDTTAIEVSCESRQKSMIFTNVNGYIVRDIVKFVLDDEFSE